MIACIGMLFARKFNVNQIEVNKGESLTAVSNGLYTVLGNDIAIEAGSGDLKDAYISMYDNDGVLRVEIPIINAISYRLLFDENGMYFNVSKSRIVRMDPTGYVDWVYQLDKLFLHHDYLFGNRGDLVVLGSDKTEGTVEDVIFSIDLETKKINTIIKIDNIYDDPTIDYMIGSENFWKGTGYEQYLLKQEGDFGLHAGQHAATYTEASEGGTDQYYIYQYNNNKTVSYTRPGYDWNADPSYEDTKNTRTSNGAKSYYYKYLIDMNNRTFTLVDQIEAEYSGYVSCAQEHQGNIMIASGFPRTLWEYDSDGELIQEIKVAGNNYLYRILKYDFEGYWFHNQ